MNFQITDAAMNNIFLKAKAFCLRTARALGDEVKRVARSEQMFVTKPSDVQTSKARAESFLGRFFLKKIFLSN